MGITFRGYGMAPTGLHLGKVHGQVEIMEHSQLDFTAVGVTADYFHTFLTLFKKKHYVYYF